MQATNERFVYVQDMSPENMPEAFTGTGPLEVPKPLEFAPVVMRYFRAEHAQVDNDLVVHLFVSESVQQKWTPSQIQNWWLNDFATAMSDTAEDYFGTTSPRLVAKYTEEVASWWLTAQGCGHVLDPDAYLRAFYAQLDETLHDALLRANGTPTGKA